IESLLHLFSSRKLEVPRTSCQKKKKREEQKQGYKSIKDVGRKGSLRRLKSSEGSLTKIMAVQIF
ncbi:hypothetical protein S83_019436, partial [Arachis hypogaea]